MKARLRLLLALGLVGLTALAVSAGAGAKSSAPKQPGKVVGYFIEWGIYGRGYTVKNVETSGSAGKLDVVNYAFANAAPDGSGNVTCQLADEWADYQKPWAASESVDGQEVTWPRPVLGNFQQLQALKALHPNMKVVISIGGWSFSHWFSDAALTPASRAAFVSSCVDLFIKGNLPNPGWGGMGGPGSAAGIFDGVDLDWEWPGSDGNTGNIIRPEDKQNFTALVHEFRTQLDAYGATTGKHYLLSSFLPAADSKIDAGFEVSNIFHDLDLGSVQGYDLHGPWDSTTNHQSNLFSSKKDPSSPQFSVDNTVNAYLSRGAPASKIVIGVPFYSHGWTGVTNAKSGLYQTATGAAPGVWEAGTDDYKVVKDLLGQGYIRYWDGQSQQAWLFNGQTFWTFDDPQVMTAKAHYSRKHGLGGVMFWELSGDTPSGELIGALDAGL